MPRTMNFSAGPAALPLPALERARDELLDFAGTGMSVMEQSHRGADYEAVHDEAIALTRELLGVPATHEVLFLQGGASTFFALLPMNLLEKGRSADYVLNGVWGEKAWAEARQSANLLGAQVHVAGDTGTGEGKAKTWTRVAVQGDLKPSQAAAYLHFTTNETIHGVQYGVDPGRPFPVAAGAPLVADMS